MRLSNHAVSLMRKRLPALDSVKAPLLEQLAGREQRLHQLPNALQARDISQERTPFENWKRLNRVELSAISVPGCEHHRLIAGTQAALVGEALHATRVRRESQSDQQTFLHDTPLAEGAEASPLYSLARPSANRSTLNSRS